ncbi:hypothetical protein ACFFKH_02750 [Micromonospora marina]|uniref:hypothetical protein n=1 Tax=Micromonospora marina TaxID=307120 RepID=UPI001ABF5C34|nr:hypothetical protein [Micromonospora marina]
MKLTAESISVPAANLMIDAAAGGGWGDEHRLVAGRVQQPYPRGEGRLALDHPQPAGGAQRRQQPGRQRRVEQLHGRRR